MTFDELCSEANVSVSSAKRYVPEMLEAGLLRKIKAYKEVTGARNLKRANDTNIYQPGPVLLANWHAVLEGCSSRVKSGGPSAKRATFAAQELRQDAKSYRRERELAARDSHPSPGLPGKLRRPDVDGHESDAQGHNADAFPRRRRATPPPTDGPTSAEIDAVDIELAELSAERSSVGAAEDLEPGALAEGAGLAAAAHGIPRTKSQGGLTTRSRSKDRAPSGRKRPAPSASAPGSKSEAAPTLERSALCRGSTEAETLKGSRRSHSFDGDQREPWPLARGKNEANKSWGSASRLAVTPNHEPRPHEIKPEPTKPPIRGEELRATTAEAEGGTPSTVANYDWRRLLREHVRDGGSLRFLDPRLKAELGFEEGEE